MTPRKPDSLRVRLIGVGYLIAWRLTRMVPEAVARRWFDWASHRSWRRNHKRRGIVTENLRAVVGDGPILEETVRKAFESYGQYWMEAFRLQDLTDAAVEARLRFEGAENIDDGVAAGGAVLGVPHLGNWDAAGRYVAKRWGLAVVVEVLRPRALFRRFVAYRRSLGMEIIPLERGADATGRCLEQIKEGRVIALVCDRDLTGRGVEVTMFGRRTRLPAGPAVVALRAGVRLLPGATYHAPDGRWLVRAFPPVCTGQEQETPEEIARIMQRLADVFEQMIREAPEQWHAFVPYWTG